MSSGGRRFRPAAVTITATTTASRMTPMIDPDDHSDAPTDRGCRTSWAPVPQSAPSAHTSCFQIGADSLSASIAKRAASNAWARWGADTTAITDDSPMSMRPNRCSNATRPVSGHRRRSSAHDLAESRNDLLVVGLIGQVLDARPPLGVIADRATEQHDRTALRLDRPVVGDVDGQLGVGEPSQSSPSGG